MSTPQTPDSVRKSQREQAPVPSSPKKTPDDRRDDALSNPDEGDRAETRQGGH